MDSLNFKPIGNEDREKILDFIRASIEEGNPDKLRRALFSLDWVEPGDGIAISLMALVREGTPELARIALDGLARLEAGEIEAELAGFIQELFSREDPSRKELLAESLRTLGQVGGLKSVEILAAFVRGGEAVSPDDSLAAVEGLVSLGVREVGAVGTVLERLHAESSGELKEALAQALRELNVAEWGDKGFYTIEARLERDKDAE